MTINVYEPFNAPKSICICDHTGDGPESSHANEPLLFDGIVDRGAGPCTFPGCTCQRFTWLRWTRQYQHYLDTRVPMHVIAPEKPYRPQQTR